jgi:hypothetical protein
MAEVSPSPPRSMVPHWASHRPVWQTAHVEPRQASTPTNKPRQLGRTEFLRFSPRSPFHLTGVPSKSADENALNTKPRRMGQDRFGRPRPPTPRGQPKNCDLAGRPKWCSSNELRWQPVVTPPMKSAFLLYADCAASANAEKSTGANVSDPLPLGNPLQEPMFLQALPSPAQVLVRADMTGNQRQGRPMRRHNATGCTR